MLNYKSISGKLKKYNKKEYFQFNTSILIAFTLIFTFANLYMSNTLQKTMEYGTDSNQMIMSIFILCMVGCTMLVIYSAEVFLKYKSREIGVFISFGLTKKEFVKIIAKEILAIVAKLTVIAGILSLVFSFGIWKFFQIIYSKYEIENLSLNTKGILIGIIFSILIFVIVYIRLSIYIRRYDVMELMHSRSRTDKLKRMKKPYLYLGLILSVAGVSIGYFLPQWYTINFDKASPTLFSPAYIFSFIGIYMVLYYFISNPKKSSKRLGKYYNNIAYYNITRLQGKQIIGSMFSMILIFGVFTFSFFNLVNQSGGLREEKMEYDFSIPLRLENNILDKNIIQEIAKEHKIEIGTYKEYEFSELLSGSNVRNWDDNAENIIEKVVEEYKYYEFISESEYNSLSNKKIDVGEGQYINLVRKNNKYDSWESDDDLKNIKSIDGKQMKVNYQGTLEDDVLVDRGLSWNKRYILDDGDYEKLTRGISEGQKIKNIVFNIEGEKKFEFSEDVFDYILENTPKEMAVQTDYDKNLHRLVKNSGRQWYTGELEEYETEGTYLVSLNKDNSELQGNWKYYPRMNYYENTASFVLNLVKVLLSGFIVIIALTATVFITYNRASSIFFNNINLFKSMKKLGATNKNILTDLKTINRRTIVYPVIGGGILAFTIVVIIILSQVSLGIEVIADLILLLISYLIVITVKQKALNNIEKAVVEEL